MMPSNVPKYRLVYVEWEDHAGTDGWMSFDDAVRSNDDAYIVRSVGWLIADSRKRITIAASIAPEPRDDADHGVCGQMTIARALIKRMRTIRIG